MRALALRFGTGFEYVDKIVGQWRSIGKKERVAQSQHGPRPRIDEAVQDQLQGWLREQPDRTLAELGELLRSSGVQTSRSCISVALGRMGLRLKKSPSTRPNATPKSTTPSAKSSLPRSPTSRRKA